MQDITWSKAGMAASTRTARWVSHEPCEECGSRDNKAVYDDGHTFCFGCRAYTPPTDGTEVSVQDRQMDNKRSSTFNPVPGEYHGLPKRSLTEETCRKWNYQTGSDKSGTPCHIANYYSVDHKLVAQKIRKPGKEFYVTGDGGSMDLYGKWLWFGKSTRSIVITEGEIDALSVSQAFDHKYPVVSLPKGAAGAENAIRRDYEWLSSFEKVVLMLDQDERGQEATEKVAAMLPVGKVFISHLDYKDANEVLIKIGPQAIVKAYWNATPWRPDGIVAAPDLRDAVLNPVDVPSVPYPWSSLNEKVGGLRKSEIVTLTAGSGCGKTTIAKEVAHHLLQQNQAVGMLMLEENNTRTMEGMITIELSKNIVVDRSKATEEEIANGFDAVANRNLYLYNHFGSGSIDSILDRIRYLVRGCDVDWIVLDHLSILISGLEVSDERKQIDIGMTKLRTLVEELGCGLILVSHLRRPEGDKGHEDGAVVRLGQLRGSHAIAQLSDIVIGVQRYDDPNLQDTVELVVLKNRWSGDRGSGGLLNYDRETGRMSDSSYF